MTQRAIVILAQLAVALSVPAAAWSREYELPPAQRLEPGRSLRRAIAPFQIELRAALIAPRKDSGASWDAQLGAGRVQQPGDFMRDTGMLRQLVKAIRSASGIGVVTTLLPWTLGAFTEGAAAPDVEIRVMHDGTHLVTASKVPNKFIPTWIDVVIPALPLTPLSSLVFDATDVDLALPDKIGTCWIDGIPLIDEDSYVAAESLHCSSQLWALSIFIRELGEHTAPAVAAPASSGTTSSDSAWQAPPTPRNDDPPRPADEAPLIGLATIRDLWNKEGNDAVRKAWVNRRIRINAVSATPIRKGDVVFRMEGQHIRCLRYGRIAEHEFDAGSFQMTGVLLKVSDNELTFYNCRVWPLE